MATQVQGFGGAVAEVDPSFRALRVTARPLEFGSLGVYALSVVSGVIAAGLAAGSEVLQFRWTDATRLAAILAIICDGAGGIVAFAAGVTRLDAVIARAFTVNGTGGNPATMTTNNAKLRTSMGTSLVGEIRSVSTAALGVGTKTLDAQAIGQVVSSVGVTAGTPVLPPDTLFDCINAGQHPIILVQNEGFACRATAPATGTWTLGITARWAELTSY